MVSLGRAGARFLAVVVEFVVIVVGCFLCPRSFDDLNFIHTAGLSEADLDAIGVTKVGVAVCAPAAIVEFSRNTSLKCGRCICGLPA